MSMMKLKSQSEMRWEFLCTRATLLTVGQSQQTLFPIRRQATSRENPHSRRTWLGLLRWASTASEVSHLDVLGLGYSITTKHHLDKRQLERLNLFVYCGRCAHIRILGLALFHVAGIIFIFAGPAASELAIILTGWYVRSKPVTVYVPVNRGQARRGFWGEGTPWRVNVSGALPRKFWDLWHFAMKSGAGNASLIEVLMWWQLQYSRWNITIIGGVWFRVTGTKSVFNLDPLVLVEECQLGDLR